MVQLVSDTSIFSKVKLYEKGIYINLTLVICLLFSPNGVSYYKKLIYIGLCASDDSIIQFDSTSR